MISNDQKNARQQLCICASLMCMQNILGTALRNEAIFQCIDFNVCAGQLSLHASMCALLSRIYYHVYGNMYALMVHVSTLMCECY